MDTLAEVIVVGLVLLFFVSPIVKGFKEGSKTTGKQVIDTSHLPEQFIAFDLETTGLDADKHEIIEIAAIKFMRGRTSQQTFQGLVKPSKPPTEDNYRTDRYNRRNAGKGRRYTFQCC